MMEQKVNQESKEILESKEYEVHQVNKGHLEIQDQLEIKEKKVDRVIRVREDHQVKMVLKVKQEVKA